VIQAILCYQFIISFEESGEIEPEFKPLKLIFNNPEFNEQRYSDLIVENDIFGIFYQHTTGLLRSKDAISTFYSGRLKETPFQVVSFFRQETDGSQFITILFFDIDDEIERFEDLILSMSKRLTKIFGDLKEIDPLRKLVLYDKAISRVDNELRYTLYQIDRLFQLDKLQKAALLFYSDERKKILEILRERPISKKELKEIIDREKAHTNIDILLDTFLDLNLVRRDWIKGEKDKKTGIVKNQGEYLFLVKDIVLSRIPCENIINRLRENRKDLYSLYKKEIADFFSNYDPNKQTEEEVKNIATILLNPDVYDFFALLRNSYYPITKIPKIFSDWFKAEDILAALKELKIITTIKDKEDTEWLILLTDIKPLVIFPEYLLPKIRESFKAKDEDQQITYEVAKKALDLLEVSYPEKLEL